MRHAAPLPTVQLDTTVFTPTPRADGAGRVGFRPHRTRRQFQRGGRRHRQDVGEPQRELRRRRLRRRLAYASQIAAIEKEITSTDHLGGSFPDPVYVEVNTKNVLFLGDTTASLMYTSGCFMGAIPGTGAVDSCTVHVQPRALTGKGALSTSDIHEALIHEMVHCYMFQKFGAPVYDFPPWFIEGSADWVANEIAGSNVVDGHWETYLEHPDDPLWNRSYDGFGFFVHLAESGTDPWQKIIPMAAALVASGDSNVSAWSAAAPATEFLDNWGAGFAQGRYPGTPWDSTGPGLPRYPAALPAQKPVKDLLPITVPSATAATVTRAGMPCCARA